MDFQIMSYQNRIVHYIPPAKYNPIEKEFVQPSSADYFIHWLFDHRCIVCRRSENIEINEIMPRGRSKKNLLDWKNRVLVCRDDHDEFHHNGVTPDKIATMQKQREDYLRSIGRGAYI